MVIIVVIIMENGLEEEMRRIFYNYLCAFAQFIFCKRAHGQILTWITSFMRNLLESAVALCREIII